MQQKTHRKKCFVCKKYDNVTLKKCLDQYRFFTKHNRFKKNKTLDRKIKSLKYRCSKCK